MLNSGERQVSPTLDGIRADHRARYEWVAERLKPGSFVLDYGCGVGYGAYILAQAGHKVVAVDCDEETIAYAREHYGHENIDFRTPPRWGPWLDRERFDAAIAFEVIEHIDHPAGLLQFLRERAAELYASVPNEQAFPFRCAENGFQGWAFHHRHYTPAEFRELLAETGWHGRDWYTQAGRESPVEPGLNGRTIIGVATPCELRMTPPTADAQTAEPIRETYAEAAPTKSGPGHVVILGLGPSAERYMDTVKRMGGRKAFCDEVWAINALGDVLKCDRIFHMDDIRVQEMRAAAMPDSNIARMVDWLRTTTTPVMTSRAHPSYPALVEFPLEDVINSLGYAYFNGTAAYAVAYAIYLGATKISLFGIDFTLHNSHHAEKGRGCVEFWLGFAAAKGIALGVADTTTLLDTVYSPRDHRELGVYGYDFDHVFVDVVEGSAKISLKPRAKPPTAAEIEARYDHSSPTVAKELLAKS